MAVSCTILIKSKTVREAMNKAIIGKFFDIKIIRKITLSFKSLINIKDAEYWMKIEM